MHVGFKYLTQKWVTRVWEYLVGLQLSGWSTHVKCKQPNPLFFIALIAAPTIECRLGMIYFYLSKEREGLGRLGNFMENTRRSDKRICFCTFVFHQGYESDLSYFIAT